MTVLYVPCSLNSGGRCLLRVKNPLQTIEAQLRVVQPRRAHKFLKTFELKMAEAKARICGRDCLVCSMFAQQRYRGRCSSLNVSCVGISVSVNPRSICVCSAVVGLPRSSSRNVFCVGKNFKVLKTFEIFQVFHICLL